MWNLNLVAENSQGDDDTREVKVFAQDTRNDMVTTWPPQSYTCTFCKREFRSAQALGGHMNVHRRDRARLHQAPPNLRNSIFSSHTSSRLFDPTQEVRNGGMCLLYSLPKLDTTFKPSSLINVKAVTPHNLNSSLSNSSNTEASMSTKCESNENVRIDKKRKKTDIIVEGVDLELRLGSSSLAS
ncbi:hypothetical protein L1887_40406 [Cichorium endivia]|nr:hypothetical protein L1887_40406 [Cichorium endivia]